MQTLTENPKTATFKVETPDVTLYDFQLENFISFAENSVKILKASGGEGVPQLVASWLESDLNHFKSIVKKAALKGANHVQ